MEGELRVCDPEKSDSTRDIETWRIFKIMAEFIEGFTLLRKYKLAITFFGSARSQLGVKTYTDATELGRRLSESGFAIITGGAAGIMEAANKGAYEAGGASIGLNIRLASEQQVNHYLTESQTYNYFFSRKVMLAFASEAYIFFPGGYGTLDEFLEILTLSQTHKIKRVPIILYDKAYWGPLTEFFEEHLLKKYKTISEGDLDLYHVVDSVDEAYEYILTSVKC
ncbi:TIGR00730 family Rossman fold protein [Candidatus Kaiserbacteria bacterium]|nr:TIGR00730 family Rossman fold protein [Candidatus Kaiserbacteria bacterium]